MLGHAADHQLLLLLCTKLSLLMASSHFCCAGQVTKLHHDLEEAIHTNSQLLADSSARQVELRSKEEELAGLRVEILKVIKVICLSHKHF